MLADYTQGDDGGTPLKVGVNVIAPAAEGIIYFINELPTDTPPTVTIVGAYPFAHYILGQHTYADWVHMLEAYKDIPAIELVGSAP